jgi:3',5'-cyclic AMP phosphodiesterase CpdA
MRRGAIHRPEVLDAMLDDLRDAAPEQILITGDLTNVSLESEFPLARDWLRRIGSPERVTLVPGNHDAYVRVARARSWDLWSEYLESDAAGRELLGEGVDAKPGGIEFPSVRLRGPLAIVGLSSAQPTLPFLASGAVGAAQLGRLERVLQELAASDYFRVVLIHHPPVPGVATPRRALRDAPALCSVLWRTGADLVLHGHMHRTGLHRVRGRDGTIPVVGVRSSSDMGSKPHKRAQYHLYDVESDGRSGGRPCFRIAMRTRGFDAAARRFVSEGEAVRDLGNIA